ncbi:MAG TPA: TIGR00282 family metallophosphoesterase [Alphaproteobacteria bacterium]|nr:TIGR00282 family metallophosphoesterase [Alphaproteobacteria bacterium]
MKILFLGDIMGRSGREAVARHLPALKERFAPDFIVANAENAAAGYGLTRRLADEVLNLGIDVLTNGNHVWDQKEFLSTIGGDARLLRPCNFPKDTPGLGHQLYTSKAGKRLLVINAMTRLFMDALDDPFAAIDAILAQHQLGKTADAIFVDIHGEASSEKQALGVHLDGRVTAVIGTHTHVPTADARVMPGGTAYQTDAGMCGDYDSVIGMKKDQSVFRFLRKYTFERLTPADGEGTVCGAVVETAESGLATGIVAVRVGGILGTSF